jgi:hypothetical protein
MNGDQGFSNFDQFGMSSMYPQQTMNQPNMNQPNMNQTNMNQPNMNQPNMNQPNMNQQMQYNPNMNQNQQNNLYTVNNIHNKMTSQMTSQMTPNSNDLSMRLASMQKERGQNFRMGGRGGTISNIQNNNNDCSSSNGIDHQALLHMSVDDIESQIRKELSNSDIKLSNVELSENDDENDDENDNDDNDDDNNDNNDNDRTRKLLNIIQQMKKDNKKDNKKENKKDNKKESSSESSSDSSLESSSEEEIKKKPNKLSNRETNKSVKFKNEEKSFLIDITSNEKDPKYYSDYMINFNKPYTNITIDNIKLNDKLIFNPKITNNNNELKIICGTELRDIQLDEDYYSLDDILEGITENLSDINISIMLNDDGHVEIVNNEGEKFNMICGSKSFGKFIGFTEEKYEGLSNYVAEATPELNLNEIFIFFPNLDKVNPIFSLNQNQEIKCLTKLKPITNLKSLIVQFKKSSDPTKKDFIMFESKPELSLEVTE